MKILYFKFAPISSEISQKVYTVWSEPTQISTHRTTSKPTPDVEQSEESLVTRENVAIDGETNAICACLPVKPGNKHYTYMSANKILSLV